MAHRLRIDFVSDVSCPWCAIGLHALEAALAKLSGEVEAELRFQPFELNPSMPPGGEGMVEHLARKYGIGPEEVERSQAMIRERGAQLGFTFDMHRRSRIYNTFDAHRLLHWAEGEGRQRELKHALFGAYFTQGRDPGDHEVLLDVAAKVGLDVERARQVLASGEYTNEVRERERFYTGRGIRAVPAIILDERHLIQGGQPVEVFEQALRRVAAQAGA